MLIGCVLFLAAVLTWLVRLLLASRASGQISRLQMGSVRMLVLAGALLLGGASESIAATTYQYTGKLFTLFSGATYDTSHRIAITLVLSSQLTSNYIGVHSYAIDFAPLILNNTFDDELQTLTSEHSSFYADDVFVTE